MRRAIGWTCAVAAGALLVSPLSAAARPAQSGTAYGGVIAQEFPVVIETSRNGRKVVRATIAIRLTCTSGAVVIVPDGYNALSVSKQRKFGTAFGPMTN